MADQEYRHHTLDYSRPSRQGSAGGALLLVAGIIALFFIAMLFMGGGDGGAPVDPAADSAAPVASETIAPGGSPPVTSE